MKTLYILKQNLMNGTVTMKTMVSAFTDKEVAEKAKKAVIMANANNLIGFNMYCEDIEEIQVYENENEVPILNKELKTE
jgi:hypothetical protein